MRLDQLAVLALHLDTGQVGDPLLVHEHLHGRTPVHPGRLGNLRILSNINLDKVNPALVLVNHLVQNRLERPARTARR